MRLPAGVPTRQLTTFAPLEWTTNGSAALDSFRDTLLPRVLTKYTEVEAAMYKEDNERSIERCDGDRAAARGRPGLRPACRCSRWQVLRSNCMPGRPAGLPCHVPEV